MQKTKQYYNVRFPFTTIKKSYEEWKKKGQVKQDAKPTSLRIEKEDEWDYDTVDEFYAEYPQSIRFGFSHGISTGLWFSVLGTRREARVSVALSSKADIESIFQIFEADLDGNTIKTKDESIKIFIGHGRNQQWRDLKDHLHEQHGFDVEVYEIGSRAGLSVKEVLEKMMANSSIAFLVLTGEDVDKDEELHARENVIHELGLFQGHLGFNRAIAVKEDGVKEFSNIIGLNQIRFSKGNIKETYGDILATIKREFSSD